MSGDGAAPSYAEAAAQLGWTEAGVKSAIHRLRQRFQELVRDEVAQTVRSGLASAMTFPLTAYIEAAMELARYDKLEEGGFAGGIPKLPGVIAFGKTVKQCEHELRSTLEDWILVGLRLGHKLPKLAGIDLNQRRRHGRMASHQKA